MQHNRLQRQARSGPPTVPLAELFLEKIQVVQSRPEKERVVDRINRLKELVEAQPKTLQWTQRAKVGTSKQWYNEAEAQRDQAHD